MSAFPVHLSFKVHICIHRVQLFHSTSGKFCALLDDTMEIHIFPEMNDFDILYIHAGTHLQEPVSAPQPGRCWLVNCGTTAGTAIP